MTSIALVDSSNVSHFTVEVPEASMQAAGKLITWLYIHASPRTPL